MLTQPLISVRSPRFSIWYRMKRVLGSITFSVVARSSRPVWRFLSVTRGPQSPLLSLLFIGKMLADGRFDLTRRRILRHEAFCENSNSSVPGFILHICALRIGSMSSTRPFFFQCSVCSISLPVVYQGRTPPFLPGMQYFIKRDVLRAGTRRTSSLWKSSPTTAFRWQWVAFAPSVGSRAASSRRAV